MLTICSFAAIPGTPPCACAQSGEGGVGDVGGTYSSRQGGVCPGAVIGAPCTGIEESSRGRRKGEGAPHFLEYTPAVLDRLRNAQSHSTKTGDDQDQNSKADDFFGVGSSSSSSSSNNVRTTTTTTHNTASKARASVVGEEGLIHPRALSDNQRGLTQQYLKMVAPHDQQRDRAYARQ